MGIYFQPDMTKARELSQAGKTVVLFPGAQDEDTLADHGGRVSVDFLCAIKELQHTGKLLKGPLPV
jgi:hypothetical protein